MSSTASLGPANPVLHAARLGMRRGGIEMMHSLTNRADQIWIVVMNGIFEIGRAHV